MNEANFSKPSKMCPHPERWTAEDNLATENEVIELLGSLVRALQPDYVLETGTYRGVGAYAMVAALVRNGHGLLHTIEIEPRVADEAIDRLRTLAVDDRWKVTNSPACSVLLPPGTHIDLAFFDSGHERHLEFLHFSKWMSQRTIVVFHDSHDQCIQWRPFYDQLADDGWICPVYLPTPRGIAICQVLKTKQR